MTTQGTVRPCRASRRIVRAIETYGPRLDRYSGVSGLVGSQARSQAALRTRVSRQIAASFTRTGRRPTGKVEKVRLGQGDRPAAHASHGTIIPWLGSQFAIR